MSVIDIAKDNIRHLTAQELRDYAEKGLLYAGDICLSEFVNKILVDAIFGEDLEDVKIHARNQGYDDGWKSGFEAGLND